MTQSADNAKYLGRLRETLLTSQLDGKTHHNRRAAPCMTHTLQDWIKVKSATVQCKLHNASLNSTFILSSVSRKKYSPMILICHWLRIITGLGPGQSLVPSARISLSEWLMILTNYVYTMVVCVSQNPVDVWLGQQISVYPPPYIRRPWVPESTQRL